MLVSVRSWPKSHLEVGTSVSLKPSTPNLYELLVPGFELGELGLGGACALLAAMEVLLLLGVGGGGGVGGV